MRKRQWKGELDLARQIMAEVKLGKDVRLSNATAHFVALKLVKASTKPSRDDVARMVCWQNCAARCYTCVGRANIIVAAYGESVPLEEKPFAEMTPAERERVVQETIARNKKS